MTIEHNNGVRIERGPEIKWRGPERLDGLTGRLVAAGLLMYEAFHFPLKKSLLTIDFSERTVYIERHAREVVEDCHANRSQ